MRTTLTLDDDLAIKLKERARERDVSFKQVVNDAIRAGLAGGTSTAKRFRVKPRRMGPARVDLTKALRLAGQMEDEEIIRKLNRGA